MEALEQNLRCNVTVSFAGLVLLASSLASPAFAQQDDEEYSYRHEYEYQQPSESENHSSTRPTTEELPPPVAEPSATDAILDRTGVRPRLKFGAGVGLAPAGFAFGVGMELGVAVDGRHGVGILGQTLLSTGICLADCTLESSTNLAASLAYSYEADPWFELQLGAGFDYAERTRKSVDGIFPGSWGGSVPPTESMSFSRRRTELNAAIDVRATVLVGGRNRRGIGLDIGLTGHFVVNSGATGLITVAMSII